MTLLHGDTKVGSSENISVNFISRVLCFSSFRGGSWSCSRLCRLDWLSFGRTGHTHGFKILDSFTISLLDLLQLGNLSILPKLDLSSAMGINSGFISVLIALTR